LRVVSSIVVLRAELYADDAIVLLQLHRDLAGLVDIGSRKLVSTHVPDFVAKSTCILP
jgi:hypothetical protein